MQGLNAMDWTRRLFGEIVKGMKKKCSWRKNGPGRQSCMLTNGNSLGRLLLKHMEFGRGPWTDPCPGGEEMAGLPRPRGKLGFCGGISGMNCCRDRFSLLWSARLLPKPWGSQQSTGRLPCPGDSLPLGRYMSWDRERLKRRVSAPDSARSTTVV